ERALARAAAGPRARMDPLPQSAGHAGERDRLPLAPRRAGVEPRQVEEVARETGQPFDLLAHRGEELRVRLVVEVLVGEQLEEPAEREERRPQLVRGVRDELGPRAVEVREAKAHPVEGARELAELVRRRVVHRLVEVAARDAVGGPLEPADAAREDRRAAEPERERSEQGGDAGDEQAALHEVDVAEGVVEGRGEEEDLLVLERNRDLREALVPPRERAVLRLARRRRAKRHGVVL